MSEPFKNEWTPEAAREIDKYWAQSALEAAVHIVETVGILQSCSPGNSLLEVGCGTGHIYRLVKQSNIGPYTGLDISQAMLDIFKEKFSDVPLVLGDVQSLPFKDGSFDIVVCVEVLRHMQYYDTAIKELVRVAKRAAIFTIEVTQGEDTYFGEERKGAYLQSTDNIYVHYQVEINSNKLLEWIGEEFEYHVDIKPITANKWMLVVNKYKPGKSMSLSPIGGMDSFMSEISNGLGKAFKLFKTEVPDKIMKMDLKAAVESVYSRGVDFSITIDAVDNDELGG